MKISRTIKRVATAAATAAALATTIVVGTAGSASASTIGNGYVQLCSQGDYASYVQFPYRGGFSSYVVSPGQCWLVYMGGNSWEPIEVHNQWGGQLATFWYDGAVSGIGIGTEGYGGNEYVWTW